MQQVGGRNCVSKVGGRQSFILPANGSSATASEKRQGMGKLDSAHQPVIVKRAQGGGRPTETADLIVVVLREELGN